MEYPKSLWQLLDGRKRAIGLAAAFIYGGLVTAGLVDYNDTVVALILAWTGVGYIHAAKKG